MSDLLKVIETTGYVAQRPTHRISSTTKLVETYDKMPTNKLRPTRTKAWRMLMQLANVAAASYGEWRERPNNDFLEKVANYLFRDITVLTTLIAQRDRHGQMFADSIGEPFPTNPFNHNLKDYQSLFHLLNVFDTYEMQVEVSKQRNESNEERQS